MTLSNLDAYMKMKESYEKMTGDYADMQNLLMDTVGFLISQFSYIENILQHLSSGGIVDVSDKH